MIFRLTGNPINCKTTCCVHTSITKKLDNPWGFCNLLCTCDSTNTLNSGTPCGSREGNGGDSNLAYAAERFTPWSFILRFPLVRKVKPGKVKPVPNRINKVKSTTNKSCWDLDTTLYSSTKFATNGVLLISLLFI